MLIMPLIITVRMYPKYNKTSSINVAQIPRSAILICTYFSGFIGPESYKGLFLHYDTEQPKKQSLLSIACL